MILMMQDSNNFKKLLQFARLPISTVVYQGRKFQQLEMMKLLLKPKKNKESDNLRYSGLRN